MLGSGGKDFGPLTPERAKWESERKFRRAYNGDDRICLECAKQFKPTQKKQLYCTQKCYKGAVRRKEIADAEQARPWYWCKKCLAVSRLRFAPKIDVQSMIWFKCPGCGVECYTPYEREMICLEDCIPIQTNGHSKGGQLLGYGKPWQFVKPEDMPKPPVEAHNSGHGY